MTQFFRKQFGGGFECSSHRRRDGVRLDIIAGTAHDRYAAADYRLLQRHGMGFARDGLRWHLIERSPGCYDWSSFLPMLEAARETDMQVFWDLLHYGWPDWIDPWHPDFAMRFADFAAAAAALIREPAGRQTCYVPVNEMSFLAWGGGEVGYMNPLGVGRGDELKAMLASAFIGAARAIRSVDGGAVIACAEPLIRVHPWWKLFGFKAARAYREVQYHALDMVLGRHRPELGGFEDAVDIIGINYYPQNQWLVGGRKVMRGHILHVPLSDLLLESAARYDRPMFIAETGCESDARPDWLNYVAGEVLAARGAGADIQALCLYPILNHLGWDDDRYCPNGLFCGVAPGGERTVYSPLATELAFQQTRFEQADRLPVDQPASAGPRPITAAHA